MEDSGVEVTKRQRLDPLTGVSTLRTGPLPQHSGSPASEAIHGYSAQQPTLAPPNAYAEPVPPSPYQPIPEAARALAEHPGSAGFAHGLPHSGYSTPVREAHAPLPDRAPVFSRNGHHHHPPQLRDPNELPHPGAIRPHSSNFDAEGHVYPPASAQDPADAGAPPYVAHEPTTNGLYAHGLPMATHHDPVQQPPPGNVVQYAEAPGGAVGHAPQGGPPYSAGPYPPHSPWNRQPMPPRKPARALQVIFPRSFSQLRNRILTWWRRLARRVDSARPSATRASQSAATAVRTATLATTRRCSLQSMLLLGFPVLPSMVGNRRELNSRQ